MLFVYLLSSALAASMVFGGSTRPTHVSYDQAEIRTRDNQTAVFSGVAVEHKAVGNDRTANLKFVLAIQRSTMWTDIKRRTVKISTNPQLTALLEANPESLSDENLALLRRACHDGLKCVAVDHLLVLRSATKKLPNGLVAVRKVITKITHVLTNYTTEYYENTYQYEEVSEADAPAKLEESVTVIVEDNKKLCGIKVGDDVAMMEDETLSTTVKRDAQNVVEGTARVRLEGGDDEAAKAPTPAAQAPQPAAKAPTPAAKTTPKATTAAKVTPKTTPKATTPKKTPTAPTAQTTAPAAQTTAPVAQTTAPVAQTTVPVAQTTAPATKVTSADKATQFNGEADEDEDDDDELIRRLIQASDQANREGDAAKQNAAAPSAAKSPSNRDDDNARFDEYDENSEDDEDDDNSLTSADVVSAGDRNANVVRKGYVEDGVINNGDMNMYKLNTGTVNKGIVNRTGANGGIVNVGTLNNGPTVYGATAKRDGERDGTGAKMDNDDMAKYMSAIDKMYSTIIEGFGNQ